MSSFACQLLLSDLTEMVRQLPSMYKTHLSKNPQKITLFFQASTIFAKPTSTFSQHADFNSAVITSIEIVYQLLAKKMVLLRPLLVAYLFQINLPPRFYFTQLSHLYDADVSHYLRSKPCIINYHVPCAPQRASVWSAIEDKIHV